MASMVKTKLIDPETNEEITVPNQPGELLYAGPTIFDGYWKSPQANAEVFSGDYSIQATYLRSTGQKITPAIIVL